MGLGEGGGRGGAVCGGCCVRIRFWERGFGLGGGEGRGVGAFVPCAPVVFSCRTNLGTTLSNSVKGSSLLVAGLYTHF